MVLFEDSAALLGILIAAAGTFAATHFQKPEFDGVASLLIGESASSELTRSVTDIAAKNPAVLRVIEIESSIRQQHSEVTALFIKPQTPKTFSDSAKDRFGVEGDG